MVEQWNMQWNSEIVEQWNMQWNSGTCSGHSEIVEQWNSGTVELCSVSINSGTV